MGAPTLSVCVRRRSVENRDIGLKTKKRWAQYKIRGKLERPKTFPQTDAIVGLEEERRVARKEDGEEEEKDGKEGKEEKNKGRKRRTRKGVEKVRKGVEGEGVEGGVFQLNIL